MASSHKNDKLSVIIFTSFMYYLSHTVYASAKHLFSPLAVLIPCQTMVIQQKASAGDQRAHPEVELLHGQSTSALLVGKLAYPSDFQSIGVVFSNMIDSLVV